MKKYAMIPINRRYDDKNNRIVRRILISYLYKNKNGIYKGTKVIELDDYFKDKKSSQQYIFNNNGFRLISNSYTEDSLQTNLIDKKRLYEYDAGYLIETSYEFKAKNKEEAIKIFKERKF